ncbi:MAG: YceI family protein [Segetibacter sp.]|nr:YceI family protein [Segetibacter sp.]
MITVIFSKPFRHALTYCRRVALCKQKGNNPPSKSKVKVMKKITLKSLAIIPAMFFTTCFTTLSAQSVFQSQVMNISLTGTSSIHDWEMKAANGKSEATFVVDANGNVSSLSRLSFTLPAKSLKSKHTMMDNNTYKALNTSKNPNIIFVLTSATVSPKGANNYLLNCVGKLTIAGTTKETDLVATGKYNPADKSFTINGVKKMKMTDYNVKPPTVMMGTIKTGNDISIAYNLKFIK